MPTPKYDPYRKDWKLEDPAPAGRPSTRAANLVYAGPASGAAAVPTFRTLVAADLPAAGSTAADYAPTMLMMGA